MGVIGDDVLNASDIEVVGSRESVLVLVGKEISEVGVVVVEMGV